MSFAGTTTTSPIGRQARRGRAESSETTTSERVPRREWRGGGLAQAGLLGTGLALGILLGAGTALLLAPASGAVTRRRLARGARRAGLRMGDVWDDLGLELRFAGARTGRRLRRRSRRGILAAEGLLDRGRNRMHWR